MLYVTLKQDHLECLLKIKLILKSLIIIGGLILWFQFEKRNDEESSTELPFLESTKKQPKDKGPSSTFLNVGDTVLLDSPATGPWLIVNETGFTSVAKFYE